MEESWVQFWVAQYEQVVDRLEWPQHRLWDPAPKWCCGVPKRQFLALGLCSSASLQLAATPLPGMDAGQARDNKSDLLLLPAEQTRGCQLHAHFCSQLLEHTKGTDPQGGKQNDNYCVGLSGVYFAVGSWPGVDAEDTVCCSSKSSRQVTLQGHVSLSLWFSSHNPRTAKMLEAIPLPPTLTCLLLPFPRLCSEQWACVSTKGATQCPGMDGSPPPSPARGPLQNREVKTSQCPDCMAGAQSSQHRPSSNFHLFFFP